MLNYLLFASAIIWIVLAVVLFKMKSKIMSSLSLFVVVLITLQGFEVINLNLLTGVALAVQFWIGLYFLFDGFAENDHPILSILAGIIAATTAVWWLVAMFQLWTMLFLVGVIIAAIATLLIGLRHAFD